MSLLYLRLYLYKLYGVRNNEFNMKRLRRSQQGFIPLLLMVLLIVGALIVVAYLRVSRASN